MALSKSGKAVSNVSKLDDARKKRTKSKSSPKVASKDNLEKPPTAPKKADEKADKPTPKTTPKAKPKVSNRRFDTVKVERLKSEIANGDYHINYLNVADKFIEHERYA